MTCPLCQNSRAFAFSQVCKNTSDQIPGLSTAWSSDPTMMMDTSWRNHLAATSGTLSKDLWSIFASWVVSVGFPQIEIKGREKDSLGHSKEQGFQRTVASRAEFPVFSKRKNEQIQNLFRAPFQPPWPKFFRLLWVRRWEGVSCHE